MAKHKWEIFEESAGIAVNDQGVPVIAGANFKVRHIAMDYIEMGNDAAEMHKQHPFLTKVQIQNAISYYPDHKEFFDTEIEESAREYERLHRDSANSLIRQKLR